MARHTAFWLLAGYSQVQIALALGYKPGNAPKALWRHATVYADWLRQSAPKVRPGDGIEAVAELENWFARGAEITSGLREPDEVPYVLSTVTDDPEEARRYVRRRWRTPRVVTVAEWEREPFGWPEGISTRLLYSEVDLQVMRRAEQTLRDQPPHHATRRVA